MVRLCYLGQICNRTGSGSLFPFYSYKSVFSADKIRQGKKELYLFRVVITTVIKDNKTIEKRKINNNVTQ